MFNPTHRAAARLVVAGILLAASPLHAADRPVAAAEGGPTIRIDNFTFSPPVLRVAPGTTVTWVNQDDIPHAIAADDKSFRSKTLDTDDAYSFTFAQPGEYGYFCSLHPHMTGRVVVTPGGG